MGKLTAFAVLLAGTLLFLSPASASASAMALEPDGGIVLAGSANQWTRYCITPVRLHRCFQHRVPRAAVARLDADGRPDPGFGVGGGVVDFRGSAGFSAVATLPGQSIRLGSASWSRFRVTALGAAGAPDGAFGDEGIAASPPAKANSAVVTTILPQPDGSLVAGGDFATFSPKVSPSNFAVVAMRFGGDGSPGPRLGEVFTDREVAGLADLVPQGDAFVAVGSLTELFEPFGFLARFSDSAFPYDPGFGGVGLVTLGPFSGSDGDVPFSAAAAAGEGLVTVGRAGGRILLARYQADGILDPGFGEAGSAGASIPIEGLRSVGSTDIVVRPDGKLVVGGVVSVSRKAFCDSKAAACRRPFLARFQPDGQLDTGFGDGGFVFGPLREAQAWGSFDLALQPDGKILFSHTVVGGSTLGVARYNADGSIDGSFGEAGEAGVLPCRGKLARRRRSGCLSTAAVRLKAHGLSHGRPVSQFSIRVSNPLDPVAAVKLVLPPELEGRKGTARRVRVLTVPRHRVRIKVRPRIVYVNRLGNARGLHVAVAAGVLHRVARVAPGKKLRFHVEVKLKDGTSRLFGFRSSR